MLEWILYTFFLAILIDNFYLNKQFFRQIIKYTNMKIFMRENLIFVYCLFVFNLSEFGNPTETTAFASR